MRAEQISIFLENKAGRLAEVTSILAEADVNIRALAIADTSDFGVLRLIVNDNQRAVEALRNRGFTVGKDGCCCSRGGRQARRSLQDTGSIIQG